MRSLLLLIMCVSVTALYILILSSVPVKVWRVAQLKPELPPDEAADIYTGHTDRVSAEALEEALCFLQYALAAYYIEVG